MLLDQCLHYCVCTPGISVDIDKHGWSVKTCTSETAQTAQSLPSKWCTTQYYKLNNRPVQFCNTRYLSVNSMAMYKSVCLCTG